LRGPGDASAALELSPGRTLRSAAEPPRDEPDQLIILERVARPEHAQLDLGEALLSQMLGHAPHVLDGPDLIPVSGGDPGPWTPRPNRRWNDVPVEDREISEHSLVSRQIRRAIAPDGEPGGEDMREIDLNAGSCCLAAASLSFRRRLRRHRRCVMLQAVDTFLATSATTVPRGLDSTSLLDSPAILTPRCSCG
jgi:hypothetical protein